MSQIYMLGSMPPAIQNYLFNYYSSVNSKASVTCMFCKKVELKKHTTNGTLEQCYKNYIQRYGIEIDQNVCAIVKEFYDLLKKISEKLNVCSLRNAAYAGLGYKTMEKLIFDYGEDISPRCEVRNFVQKGKRNRSIQSESLDQEFTRIMQIFYGRNILSRSRSVRHGEIIVIDDIDDDNNDDEVCRTTQVNDNVNHYAYEVKHEFSHSPTPDVTINPIPMDTIFLSNGQCPSLYSTSMSVSRSRNCWTPTNDNEAFALSIARKLERIPPGIQRRLLEINIEKAILDAESKVINENKL
ncbi:hypothetical protein Bhyg_01945, partial [Pseudolycoriella hygida]